ATPRAGARARSVLPEEGDDRAGREAHAGIRPPAYAASLADLRARGLEPRVAARAASHQTAIALVAAGAGVHRIPASARVPHAGVRYVEIADARSPIVLLRRPE